MFCIVHFFINSRWTLLSIYILFLRLSHWLEMSWWLPEAERSFNPQITCQQTTSEHLGGRSPASTPPPPPPGPPVWFGFLCGFFVPISDFYRLQPSKWLAAETLTHTDWSRLVWIRSGMIYDPGSTTSTADRACYATDTWSSTRILLHEKNVVNIKVREIWNCFKML